MKKNNKLVPRLRFQEFKNSPSWDIKKLEQLLSIGNGRDYKHLSKGNIPVYGSGGYMCSVDDFLYDGESVCIGRKGTINRPIFINGKFWTVDTLFYTYSYINCIPKFIYNVFQKIDWLKYNEAGGLPSLSKTTIQKIPIYIPTIEEQKKIADCLASIDDLIEAEKRKLEVLKKYKKALMQKLFPAEDASIPELRFEEFKDSGEWEYKKLSDIGESYSGLTNKNASHFIDDCNAKYITYKSIYDCDKININKLKDLFIEEGEKQNLVQYGDAFFTISSETQDEVGLSSVLLDEVSNTYLNSFCFGFRYDFNILLPEFARYYFRSNYIRKYTYILSQGITRFNLSKNKFLEIIIKIPTIKEQKKIADCLDSIDSIIDSQIKKIDNLIKHKKALMQGLFPDMESIEEYE
ncbi:restriction endonuclease subunit S [Brachyspira innocens]|uniref:restriction endonuclease subunit S n=1 Tax=Brachyspira innocens TaxID=13264 RepID=UPI0026E92BBE|nr:restriction endonuclease subunit S [Brachyspira innocens]